MKNHVLAFVFVLSMTLSLCPGRLCCAEGNNTGDDSFIIGKKLDVNISALVKNGFDPVNGVFELKLYSNDLSNDYTSHVVAKYENGALVIINNELPAPRYLEDFSTHQRLNCGYSKTEGLKSAWGGFYVEFNDKIFTLGSFSPHDPPGYLFVSGAVTEKCGDKEIKYEKGWNLAGGKIGEIPLSLSSSPF